MNRSRFLGKRESHHSGFEKIAAGFFPNSTGAQCFAKVISSIWYKTQTSFPAAFPRQTRPCGEETGSDGGQIAQQGGKQTAQNPVGNERGELPLGFCAHPRRGGKIFWLNRRVYMNVEPLLFAHYVSKS
jgi:hypothetical protein